MEITSGAEVEGSVLRNGAVSIDASAREPVATDLIQTRISAFASSLTLEDLDASTRHAAVVRFIDTVGALIGGFSGDPAHKARDVAAQFQQPAGASILGSTLKTAPDMAAFVNGMTARYVEMNDVYHWPGSAGGHPSDVVMPVFAVADMRHRSGQDFLVAMVVAYEIYLRMSDAIKTPGFDVANFCCMGSAMGAGKLLGLSQPQLAEALSMAVVPNNALNQSRTGHLSMWKAAAAGQAGRGGVFAALLAAAGLRGPHLPFEGKAGWNAHVAKRAFALDEFGGRGRRFKIADTLIKPRASCATTISSILAAEKAAGALGDPRQIERVHIEVYERAKIGMGTGAHHWNPDSRETADHSIPYVVAAAIVDRRLTPSSFSDARLWDPVLRDLLPRISVVANDEFTAAYERHPVLHCTRVTIVLKSGERLVGEAGGEKGDLSQPKSDAEISAKFSSLAEPALGKHRVDRALEAFWNLETCPDVSALADLTIIPSS